MIYAVLVATSP